MMPAHEGLALGTRVRPEFDHTTLSRRCMVCIQRCRMDGFEISAVPGYETGQSRELFRPGQTRTFENTFVVRGGERSVVHGAPNLADVPELWSPRHRAAWKGDFKDLPGLGFRCARSAAPQY